MFAPAGQYNIINDQAPFVKFTTRKIYYNLLLDDATGLSSAYKILSDYLDHISIVNSPISKN